MKKGYETPVIEKVSLESKEVVCATDFFNLFGLSRGNAVRTAQDVFEWDSK